MILDDPTCTPEKEAALREPECIQAVFKQQPLVYGKILEIVADNYFGTIADTELFCFLVVEILANYEDMTSCREAFPPFVDDGQCPPDYDYYYGDYSYDNDLLRRMGRSQRKNNRSTNSSSTRLSPLFQTLDLTTGGSIKTEVPFENTKHRYPWICSLRSRQQGREHQCGVTLLRRPPGPIVLVTAAHCTILCKSSDNQIRPNCCCENVSGECTNNEECGDNPKVVEMTGEDAEVVCGDWEIGNKPYSTSGEVYNVIMQIKDIKKHPNYAISRGAGNTQFVTNDIAAIIVDDDVYQHLFERNQIYPACLPTSRRKSSFGSPSVHSGWSTPPSLQFLFEFAPPYVAFYEDFIKQWHYQMVISECRDPLINPILGTNLTFPTNTYYPPGLICAKEFTRQFCPTSGESGSPLMVKDGEGKYYAHGILSFIKGCDVFAFGAGNSRGNRYFLNQLSENPSVYTNLFCFLPWIADQYNLEYTPSEEIDPACSIGSGDINDVTNPGNPNFNFTCRNTPSNLLEANQEIELPCIFPYYFDGQLMEECIQFDQEGLFLPLFRCPIRGMTTKLNGLNSYSSDDLQNILTGGYCQSDQIGENNLPLLNPDDDSCSSAQRRVPFSQCKNNCPGGKMSIL